MSNLDKSQERIQRYLNRRLNKVDRLIARQYALVLADIRKQLTLYYEKFEQGGVLTYAEMAKFNRLTKFIEYISELLTVNYSEMKAIIFDALGETYLEGYYLTAWAVETDTLSKLAYSAVPPATITAMIENPISGLTLSDRLEKNRADIIYKIQQEVTQGLVQGETYATMAKRLKTALEGDVNKAVRIVRTESHRVMESSKLDSAVHAQKHGVVMMKEWNNRMDERSRPDHRAADGQTIPVDEEFKVGSNKGLVPGQLSGGGSSNINCGCFCTYSVERVQKPDAAELDGMVFDTWMKERVKS